MIGVALISLTDQFGRPKTECFTTSHGDSAGRAGVADTVVGPDSRLAMGGWFWGRGLGFGGEPLSVEQRDANAFIAVLDRDGAHIWSRSIKSPLRTSIDTIDMSDAGDVLVAGGFYESADFGSGPVNAPSFHSQYVAMYEANGELAWIRVSPYASSGPGPKLSARFSSDGTLIVAGSRRNEAVFGRSLSPVPPLQLTDCAPGRMGSGPLVRPGTVMRAWAHRIFVARLSRRGELLSLTDTESRDAGVTELQATPNGGMLVGGYFRGSLGIGGAKLHAARGQNAESCQCILGCMHPARGFLAHLDRAGKVLWYANEKDGPDFVRVGAGPSTVESWGRNQLRIRDQAGAVRWHRRFAAHDVLDATIDDRKRLHVLLRHFSSNAAHYLRFSPTLWHPATGSPSR